MCRDFCNELSFQVREDQHVLTNALLSQVLTYRGFYDNNLDWVGLEEVQVIASMNAGSTLGRHQLSSRFTSIVRICCIG